MPTNHTTPSRTVAVVLAGVALGAALTFLGTVSDAASAFVGGALAGAVLVDQVRRSRPSRVGTPGRDISERPHPGERARPLGPR